jgi:cytochrome c biogenesis protein CcmG/thiol:disulfide interchange protein DsbE
MTPEQPARGTSSKVWTAGRLALAASVFALLTVALSPGCNPTDDTANTGAPAASPGSPPARDGRRPTGAAPNPVALPASIIGATLTDTKGESFKLSDYQGKVVVLNMWATWCGPCRREIPEFVALRDEFKPEDVEVLGVTMEEDNNTPEDVSEFMEDFGIQYRIAWADRDFYREVLSPGYQIPQTYVIGRDGRILRKFVGYSPQVGADVRALVTQALGG